MRATAPRSIRGEFRGRLGGFALDASFAVPAAGITGLFGPSGCGKSTVLRCLAGLQHLPGGLCEVDGDVWQDDTTFLKPHQRPIGYVFQEASLFQHLSVQDNLMYGAPKRKAGPLPGDIAFDEVIELLGLARLLPRAPRNLSGGERQRVAIGRALLSQPKLLLMDEPLSALDRLTKDEILPFLERLHARLLLPVIYVSHDMAEIERLADHLILMRAGQVIGVGPLSELQSNPALPLATSRDAAVNMDATAETYDAEYGLLTLRLDGGRLLVPSAPVPAGERRRIRIAAGDVSLSREAPRETSILNALAVRIVSTSTIGPNEVLVVLALGPEGNGARLLARVTRRSWDQLQLADGLDVFAQVKGVALAPERVVSEPPK
ncbi:molybdenum ABC transporter ATP-binding protein [Rhodopseudomonas sp. AAP120]|uniref:molybdenum ABC transporter ATP-binding protein n=1 Tax=Rhodopseudomonas sp. AAP120 TaxID=1523430 RepID=UPI0006B8AF0E|nr:molybdenum ABC transporter ATP-binding protein [Rhodopseudomonas sp. AAP120]KPG02052.1 molybdenum ABC transporter ATP-binding protein [Rhodopseudomonas sp. AAP120]